MEGIEVSEMSSVLRSWVMDLPLREQGTLLVALRGCDLAPKIPLDSPERRLTAALRFAVMVPADVREVDFGAGCFMLSGPPMDVKLSMFEHYPLHWVSHAIHACEAIGYRHPDETTANGWLVLYRRFVRSLHMKAETREEFESRLGEDRIAGGNVVSL